MISERLARYFNEMRGDGPPQAQPWMNAEEVDAVMKSRRWLAMSGYTKEEMMQTSVEVKDEGEAYLVKLGLQNPQLMAFLKVCAILKAIPDDPQGTSCKQIIHAVNCLYGGD